MGNLCSTYCNQQRQRLTSPLYHIKTENLDNTSLYTSWEINKPPLNLEQYNNDDK